MATEHEQELIEEYEHDLAVRDARLKSQRDINEWALKGRTRYRVALADILAAESWERAREIALDALRESALPESPF